VGSIARALLVVACCAGCGSLLGFSGDDEPRSVDAGSATDAETASGDSSVDGGDGATSKCGAGRSLRLDDPLDGTKGGDWGGTSIEGTASFGYEGGALRLQRDGFNGILFEHLRPGTAEGLREVELHVRVDLGAPIGFVFAFAQIGTSAANAAVRLVANDSEILVEARDEGVSPFAPIGGPIARPGAGFVDVALRVVATGGQAEVTAMVAGDAETVLENPVRFEGDLQIALAAYVDPGTQRAGPLVVRFDDLYVCTAP
jgi:hypothetical protein